MSIKEPVVVGLKYGYSDDGTPFEVKCNDFTNPDGVAMATVAPDVTTTDVRWFEVRGKRLGHVMLEARLPKPSGVWWEWPLGASVQIAVKFDSWERAKKRCAEYATKAIPSSTPGCPHNITADLWGELLKFTQKYEGPTDFMYNDKSSPKQLVTCGFGKMFATPKDAVKHKGYFVTPDGRDPTEEEMETDYAAAHSLTRTEINLFEFAEVTMLRIKSWEKMCELLGTFMGEKVGGWLKSSYAKNFTNFPRPAQKACASIAYGGWSHGAMKPMWEAVQAEDWDRVVEKFWNPSAWDKRKVEAHKALFMEAAKMAKPTNTTPASPP
jgi:hypothetical protein